MTPWEDDSELPWESVRKIASLSKCVVVLEVCGSKRDSKLASSCDVGNCMFPMPNGFMAVADGSLLVSELSLISRRYLTALYFLPCCPEEVAGRLLEEMTIMMMHTVPVRKAKIKTINVDMYCETKYTKIHTTFATYPTT